MGLGFAGKKRKRIEGIGLVMDLGCRSGDPEESEGISIGWNRFVVPFFD